MKLPAPARSFAKKQISVDELRAVVRKSAKGKFARAMVRRAAERLIEEAESGGVGSDLIVHDGDLSVAALRTGTKPFIGLLVVHGNLVVDGLYVSIPSRPSS